MSRKIEQPVTLFAQVEAAQHDKLRGLAFHEKRSIAGLVRQALDEYLERRPTVTLRAAATKVDRVDAPPPPRRKAAAKKEETRSARTRCVVSFAHATTAMLPA